jgi:ribosomal protein S6--L-glutamate ligase
LEAFKSFITEENSEKYRILVISAEPNNAKLFHTAQRVTDEAKKLGHEVYVVKVEGAYIEYDNGYKIYNADDDKGFEIGDENTVAIVRGSVRLKQSWLDLLSQLEKIGVCMVNSRQTVAISSDKYRTYLKLQDFGLTQPRTVLIPDVNGVDKAVEILDKKFPLILKTLEGSKGVGVLFIESERSLKSIIQLLFSQNEDVDLLIQEYIKTDGDIRVIVLGGKVIASMKRAVIEGDFRSNVSQGAKVKEYDLTDLEIEQCLLAAKAVDGIWTAVDFIPSSDKENKPPYILEVNHSPGTEGIEEATNKNIVKIVVDHFSNPKNRYSVPNVCGFYETLDIKPFGKLVGKFDTGNAQYSVLHADDVKADGKQITFTHHGKTVKTKNYGKYTSVTGGGDDERYIVRFDITFAGTTYKDIEFGLDNRDKMGTEVLLNRKMMSKMNVMVNPRRKYIVTTKKDI